MAGIVQPSNDGLWDDVESRYALQIDIDYEVSVEQLFVKIAAHLMFYSGAYCILATNGTFGARGGLQLPSWVPDFRYPAYCLLLASHRPTSSPIAMEIPRSNHDYYQNTKHGVFFLEGRRIATGAYQRRLVYGQ